MVFPGRLTVIAMAVAIQLTSAPLFSAARPEAGAKEVTKITFWDHNSHNAQFSDAMVVKFNREHPDILVELTRFTVQYEHFLGLAFEKGEGPDVFTMGAIDVNTYVANGWIADLSALLKPEQLKVFVDAGVLVRGNTTIGDKLVGLPAAGRFFRLYYNKDFFRRAGLDPDKPPATFDDVVAYAARLTAAGASSHPRKYGFALAGGDEDIWGQNCDYVGTRSGITFYDYRSGAFTFKSQKPLLQMYLRMIKAGSMLPGFATMTNEAARAQFAAGFVGMINGAAWDIGVYNYHFPAEIDFGICHFPTVDGTVRGKSYAYSRPEAFVNGTIRSEKKLKAAAQWLYFRSSPEWQQGDFDHGFGVPVLPGIVNRGTASPNIKGWDHFKNIDDDAFFPPRPDQGLTVVGATRSEVYRDIMTSRITDIDQALADLDARYNEAQRKAMHAGQRDITPFLVPDFDPFFPQGRK